MHKQLSLLGSKFEANLDCVRPCLRERGEEERLRPLPHSVCKACLSHEVSSVGLSFALFPYAPLQRVVAVSAASGLPCLRLGLLLRNLACD